MYKLPNSSLNYICYREKKYIQIIPKYIIVKYDNNVLMSKKKASSLQKKNLDPTLLK